MTYPSPCVNVCQIDPETQLCRGCARSRDEIRAWGRGDDETRRAILARVAERRKVTA